MPISGPVAAIIGSALGGAGGTVAGALGKKGKSSRTPIRDPAFGPLQAQLLKQALGKLRSPTQVARGIEEGGIANINEAFDRGREGLMSRLASRGLGGSGVAGRSQFDLEAQRVGQIGSLRARTPLLQQQLNQQDWLNALNLFGQERLGDLTEGSTPGGLGRGIAQGLGQGGLMLGHLSGQSMFPPKNPTPSGQSAVSAHLTEQPGGDYVDFNTLRLRDLGPVTPPISKFDPLFDRYPAE